MGDSNTPSEMVAPPVVEEEENQEPIKITFWKQGFTVSDGPLRKYDDPASKIFMSEIEKGYFILFAVGHFGKLMKITTQDTCHKNCTHLEVTTR